MARVLLRPAPQTRQNGGIKSDTAWWYVCLGRVARGCSRRPTSTVHKETKRQRYHRAAAVAVACSLKKTCSQTYLQSRRSWGLDPATTHAAEEARCASRLRPSLRYPLPVPRVGVRGRCLYGTCFSTTTPGRSGATDGRTVDKPLRNVSMCTHKGI